MPVRNMFRVFAAAAVLGTGLALFACQQAVPNTGTTDPASILLGFKDGTVGLPEGQLHYVAGGQGPVVILLHGFPEDWSAWRRVAPLLAGRFTVIMPDLRGLGGSTTTSERFDSEAMAADIAMLMANRGVEDAYIVGHDIGGPVAYALARLQPRRVRGVMLIESPLQGMPSWMKEQNSPLMWHVGFHQTAGLPEQLLAGREDIYVRYFLKLSNGGAAPDEADVARYATAYRAPDRLHALLSLYRQLDKQEAFNFAHRGPMGVPIMVVGGERVFGPLVDGMVADLRDWGATHVDGAVVPKAGHYIADEQPEALAALIEAHAGGR
jgi:pimeloyl-ACP methyl ester carboxylesterase